MAANIECPLSKQESVYRKNNCFIVVFKFFFPEGTRILQSLLFKSDIAVSVRRDYIGNHS